MQYAIYDHSTFSDAVFLKSISQILTCGESYASDFPLIFFSNVFSNIEYMGRVMKNESDQPFFALFNTAKNIQCIAVSKTSKRVFEGARPVSMSHLLFYHQRQPY